MKYMYIWRTSEVWNFTFPQLNAVTTVFLCLTSVNLASLEFPCLFISETCPRETVQVTPQSINYKEDMEYSTYFVLKSRSLKKLNT
jgi:hypothetical protein